ncbi:MAG TPA: ATP-dependent DNA ligase [Verrucomicrobiae bacterium]|nr:ATP-dependent DNA ligase [Verrucomicrobiae bacterium]
MKRFTQLFQELDETNRTNEKVTALENYFREVSVPTAAWALYFLCGRKVPRVVTSTNLRHWISEESGFPAWLVEECYEAVGDLAETAALLLPENESSIALPLDEFVQARLLPLTTLPDMAKKSLLLQTWRELNSKERLVWNKLITGSFRVGVAQTLVVRALAKVAGIEPAVMAHRLAGKWEPTAADFQRLMNPSENEVEVARPYPFYLASPLEGTAEALGDIAEWQCEWKWDGIRAQLIRRQGEALVWSRGDEMVTEMFPEVADIGQVLPDGTVLDGEILAWQAEKPQPFAALQRRLGRKTAGEKLRKEFPVVFLAYDVLECDGADWRSRPLAERRERLEKIVAEAMDFKPVEKPVEKKLITPDLFLLAPSTIRPELPLRLSEVLSPQSWSELGALQKESRERAVEGIMLKRRDSVYGVGRQRGNWWKWKIDPLVMDAVLIGAQRGHGRRASLYTDYTFGVWQADQLVPVAKAYSGLTDEEIAVVDDFVRKNTVEKFGPIRSVKPELVFELAFEAVQESTRHKAGIAVRFPRINRWRHDKKIADADTLETVRALIKGGTVASDGGEP